MPVLTPLSQTLIRPKASSTKRPACRVPSVVKPSCTTDGHNAIHCTVLQVATGMAGALATVTLGSSILLPPDAMAIVYQEELCKDAPESRKDRAVVICQGSRVEGQGYTPPAAPFLKKLDWDLDGAVSPKPGVPSLQGISGTVMTKELVGAGGALAGLTLGFVSGKSGSTAEDKECDTKAADLAKELADAQKSLMEEKVKGSELMNRIDEKRKAIKTMEAVTFETKKDVLRQEKQVKKLVKELASETKNMGEMTEKTKRLEESLRQKEEELERLRSEMKDAIKKTEEGADTKEHELNALRQQIEALTAMTNEEKSVWQSVKSENEKLTSTVAALNESLEAAREELASKRTEVQNVEDMAENTDPEVASLKVELKALKAQLTETQFVKESLGEANAQLREQVEEAKNNGGTLSPQWSATQAGDAASSNDEKVTSLEAEVKRLLAINRSLNEKRQDTQSESPTLLFESDSDLQKTNAHLEAQLAEILTKNTTLESQAAQLLKESADLKSGAVVAESANLTATTNELTSELLVLFPGIDMSNLYRSDLINLKAYIHYVDRGVFHRLSSPEEMEADQQGAMDEVQAMTDAGWTEADFAAEFARLAGEMIKSGDWSQFVGEDHGVRRVTLATLLTHLASTHQSPPLLDAPSPSDPPLGS